MLAHDSIIAAGMKQTRDPNRKRQPTPFQQGDLVYLSTQNITFQKGLTQELIPKYIGLYKILQDYGNAFFKTELPTELKRRGVHDVFHSSLLRIHLSNDDRLFPGRKDSQLGHGPEVEEEWAIDEILSHHSAKGDTLFEIKWKARDITWLPSHEILHLQVLKNYLDVHGVDKINQLPPGKENPPVSNPQISLSSIEFQLSTSRLPLAKLLKHTTNLHFFSTGIYPMPFFHNPVTIRSLIDPKIDHHCYVINMGKCQQTLQNIAHPCFSKQGQQLIQAHTAAGVVYFHVAHLLKCIEYNTILRTHSVTQAICCPIPLGYDLFAKTWNVDVTNNTSLLFFSNMCLPYVLYFYLSEHEFTYRNT
jgi:hypothetical protein